MGAESPLLRRGIRTGGSAERMRGKGATMAPEGAEGGERCAVAKPQLVAGRHRTGAESPLLRFRPEFYCTDTFLERCESG